MELIEVKRRSNSIQTRDGILLLRMNHTEALMLVRSVIGQILTDNPNSQMKTFLKDGRDFSIAVHKELK